MSQPIVCANPSAPPRPQGGSGARVIVAPKFCAPYPVDLKFTKSMDGNFIIKDGEGNVLFKMSTPIRGLMTFHVKRIIWDTSGTPVLTLRRKNMSMHDRWQVFSGKSSKQRDLLYTVKRTSMVQLSAKLEVFLAHNTEEEICDFIIVGTWSDRSCAVYSSESPDPIAEMRQKRRVMSVLFGTHNYIVRVHPNADYAFIASLVLILDYILWTAIDTMHFATMVALHHVTPGVPTLTSIVIPAIIPE
ncbi:unnamed protein product [Eruca vesicaria subsp. sativa]|uniref:Uncharacterized protein n=1 Tax=Eruca vesicaria subsp. sativa TaxID=29727 RepID=A0ABC8KFW9_ERUVS|nr:unnamed protein product [Eruca vesicaria subsp. sativa]